MKKSFLFSIAIILLSLSACKKENNNPPEQPNDPEQGQDSVVYDYDYSIVEYDNQLANDNDDNITDKSNTDIYWEAEAEDGAFANTVTITYNADTATYALSDKGKKNITVYQQGAHLAVVSKKKCEIILQGSSNNGSLKIYAVDQDDDNAEKKIKLTLNGVSLLSDRGPAINYQKGKRMYLHLQDGTDNSLEDCAAYSDDIYYLDPEGADDEDRKGCFFSEEAIIVSGHGRLEIKGNYRHGMSVDNDFYMRPGPTLLLTKAEKNNLHCNDEIHITGGYIYTMNVANGGKGIKTDSTIIFDGGRLIVNTTGTYGRDDDGDQESPKGIKADCDISINSGNITIRSLGQCEGSEGLESKQKITINGGELNVMAYDDAINAATDLIVNNGTVWCLSKHNDGIDSNGSILINGGVITSVAGNMEAALDNDNPGMRSDFIISGGEIIGIGGQVYSPSSATQYTIVYNNCKIGADIVSVKDANGTTLISAKSPVGSNRAGLLFSSNKFSKGETYYIYSGSELLQTVTLNDIITKIGNDGPGGGGGPDGPGGHGGRP